MNNEQFTPDEQALITRLQNAPQANLKPQIFEDIQQQLWAEMDAGSTTPSSTQSVLSTVPVIAIIIVVLTVLVLGFILFVSLSQNQDPIESTTFDSPSVIQTDASQAPVTENAIDDNSHIIIEGLVQAIATDTITIFDTEIQVNPADEILTQIRIGDTIRIEGESILETDSIIIRALTISIIHSTINTVTVQSEPQPSTGGLPSNCRRTPKGKITCKKSRR